MPGKRGKKKPSNYQSHHQQQQQTTSLNTRAAADPKRKTVYDAVDRVKVLLNAKSKNHAELTDWIDEAGDWLCKLEEWEVDPNTPAQLKPTITDLCVKLEERIDELDQKRQSWEDRCSFNLCYRFPEKMGVELSSDQYCDMFDSNFDDFEEWSYLITMNEKAEEQKSSSEDGIPSLPNDEVKQKKTETEKKIENKVEEKVVNNVEKKIENKVEKKVEKKKNSSKKVEKKETEPDSLCSERERNRTQMKQWKLNVQSSINSEIDDLKKLVESVYDQKAIEDLRAQLVRDIFIDQVPQFLNKRELAQSESIDECIKKLKPTLDRFQCKRVEREDQRKFVDQCSDLSIVFLRCLFGDIESSTSQPKQSAAPKPGKDASKGLKDWWVLPEAPATKPSPKPTFSKSDITGSSISDAKLSKLNEIVLAMKSHMRERPQNYEQLTAWTAKADGWESQIAEWRSDKQLMACSNVKTKLSAFLSHFDNHAAMMKEKEDSWQDYAAYTYNEDLPRKGIRLTDEQYTSFLFTAKFEDNNFTIDYPQVD